MRALMGGWVRMSCGAALALVTAFQSAGAQGWDALLLVDPFPSPYIADWQTNPTIAQLSIYNHTGQPGEVVIHFTITQGMGGVVLTSRSDPQTVMPGETVYNTTDDIPGVTDYDPELEDLVIRTGRFPEGDYTACVNLTDASGFVLVENECAEFTTVYPDPPYLVSPMDEETVETDLPIFEWMPVQAPVQYQVFYVVQIAELLPSQTPLQALTANILQFEDVNVTAPTFEYPLAGLPFESGKRYAWWVQALDQDGVPLSTNDGRSEIWAFLYSDPNGNDDPFVGDGAVRLAHTATATGSTLEDLATASFESVRQSLEQHSEGDELIIPLPFDDLNPFEDIPIGRPQFEADVQTQTMVVSGNAMLMGQMVRLVLVGAWPSDGPGVFALGIEPFNFQIDDLLDGLDGSVLDELDLTQSRIILSSSDQVLNTATMHQDVDDFFEGATLNLSSGVNIHADVDFTGTSFAQELEPLGIEDGRAKLGGGLGVDPNALFDDAGPRLAPDMHFSATFENTSVSWFPDWLTANAVALDFTYSSNPGLKIALEAPANAALDGQNYSFSYRADFQETGGAVAALTGSVDEFSVADALVAVKELFPDSDWQLPQNVERFDALALDSAAIALGLAVSLRGVDSLWANVSGTGHLDFSSSASAQSDPPSQLSASGSFDFHQKDSDTRVAGFVEVSLDSVTVFNALETVTTLLPGDWALPDDARNFDALGLDTAAVGLGFAATDDGLDSLWARVSGEGHLDFQSADPDSPQLTVAGAFEFRRITDDTWVNGFVDVDLDSVTVFNAIETATSLLPGNWSLPDEARSFDALGLDTAALNLAFATSPQGLDSVWAHVSGAGHLDFTSSSSSQSDPPSQLTASGSFDFRQINTDTWANGFIDIDLDSVTVFDAIETATSLLPGNWSLPDDARSFDALGLDTAALNLAFAAGPQGMDSLWAHVSGAGHLDFTPSSSSGSESPSQLTAAGSFDFRQVDTDIWVTGFVDVDLDSVTVLNAIETATSLLPGNWSLPDDAQNFDALGLDTAALNLAFAASPQGMDSLWAHVSGAGHLDFQSSSSSGSDSPSQLTAAGLFNFRQVDQDTWAEGFVDIDLDSVTVFNVLETATSLLPGDWALPTEARNFDSLGLDTAALNLAFAAGPEGLDSVWAHVSGVGHLNFQSGEQSQLTARGLFDFRHVASETWAEGFVDIDMDSVTVKNALETVSALLPGEWSLPGGVERFDAVGLDTAALNLAFASSPEGLDSVWARVHGSGHLDFQSSSSSGSEAPSQLTAEGLFDFRHVANDTWASGFVDLDIGSVTVTEALETAVSLLPVEWSLPDEAQNFTVLGLDTASLWMGFGASPQGLDSIWIDVLGGGHVDLPSEDLATFEGAFAFKDVGQSTWQSGHVDIQVGAITVPEAIEAVTDLLPGEWSLPDDLRSFSDLGLDTAGLGLGYGASPQQLDSLWASVVGAGHINLPSGERAEAGGDFSFKDVRRDLWAKGSMFVHVGEVTAEEALDIVNGLIPGEWGLPDNMQSFARLTLDTAGIEFGFDASPQRLDSIWAGVTGAGHIALPSGDRAEAGGSFAFKEIIEDHWVSAAMNVSVGRVTVTEALEVAAGLVPVDWEIPDELQDLAILGLDTAGLELGFGSSPQGLDSVFAAVIGAGHVELPSGDRAEAGGSFAFKDVHSDQWMSGAVNVNVGSVTVTEAIQTTATLLPVDWEMPAELQDFAVIGLDTAGIELGFGSSPQGLDSVFAAVIGAGHVDLPSGDQAAAGGSFSFKDVRDDQWVSGAVNVNVGSVTVTEALETVTSLLPGEWVLHPDLQDLAILGLDTAGLELGFGASPQGLDSVFAAVIGAGHIDLPSGDQAAAGGSFSFMQKIEDQWVSGAVNVNVGEVTVTEALETVASLLPGEWVLPDELQSFSALGLDTAGLELGFGTSPQGMDSVFAVVIGAGHVDLPSGDQAALGGRFAFKDVHQDKWVSGTANLNVGSVTVPEALQTVTSFLPGNWTLPDELQRLETLGLDTAAIELGFGASPQGLDSVFANLAGAGHIDLPSADQAAAGGSFAFKQLAEDQWVSGAFNVNVGAVTVTEALETVASLLPGDWEMPAELQRFEVLGLDTAALEMGFGASPQGLDSVFASVLGAGHIDLPSADQAAMGGRFSFKQVSADQWVSGGVDVNVGSITVPEALETVIALLPGDWALPPGAERFDALGLDTAFVGLGFAAGPQGLDSIWADLDGAGHLDLASSSQLAAGGDFHFKQVSADQWMTAAVNVNVGAVTVPEALETATTLLPGDWILPDNMQSLDALGLDTAALGLGFGTGPSGLDSVWAHVGGTGHLELESNSRVIAGGEFDFRQLRDDAWVTGVMNVSIGEVSLPEALATVANLMPGDWALPDDMQRLESLGLDTASLGMGFASGPQGLDSLWASLGGAGHLQLANGGRLMADGSFDFRRIDTETWVLGKVGMRVGEITVPQALETVTGMLPGEWPLPEGFERFGVLALDRANLDLGFAAGPQGTDSLWANLAGAGHIVLANDNRLTADGSFTYRQIVDDRWVLGQVDLQLGAMTVPDALETATGLLPGDWTLPAGFERFEVLGLDRAQLGLGFAVEPLGSDSLWANVTGAGHLDLANDEQLTADGRFSFRRVDTDTWVLGQVGMQVGEMTLSTALGTVTGLLPGEWTLPSGLESFDILALDRASLDLGFSVDPINSDSLWATVDGAGHLELADGSQVTADGDFGFRRIDTDTWVLGQLDMMVGEVTLPTALSTVTQLMPGDWQMPSGFDRLEVLALDRAALGLGFAVDPFAEDSLWAVVAGLGHLELANGEQLTADGQFAFRRIDTDTWVMGQVDVQIGELTVPDALLSVTQLLPGDWTLPDGLQSFDMLALDRGSLNLGFSVDPLGGDSVWAVVDGSGHLELANPGQLTADGHFAFRNIDNETWVLGTVDLAVGEVTVPDALHTIAELLPGDWTLPAGVESFDVLALDRATLGLGFAVVPSAEDSLWATLTGAGHLNLTADDQLKADGSFAFRRVDLDTWVVGDIDVSVADLTLTDALGMAAALLPGEWRLPQGLDGFDALALDRASFGAGFAVVPGSDDSFWAQVSGAGHLGSTAAGTEPLVAEGGFRFRNDGPETWVSGEVDVHVGTVTVPQVLQQVADFLPGEWNLPDGAEVLDPLTLDSAGVRLGFDTRPDSVWASIYGAGHFEQLKASAQLDFVNVTGESWARGAAELSLGKVTATEALDAVASFLPGDVSLPDGLTLFDALSLDSAYVQLGFDSHGDSAWAGLGASGSLRRASAEAHLGFVTVAGASYGNGGVNLSLGEVSLDDIFDLTTELLPGDWEVPDLGVDLGGLKHASFGVGFDTRTDSIWGEMSAAATILSRTAEASLTAVHLGAGHATGGSSFVSGKFVLDLGDIGISDAMELATELLPGSATAPSVEIDVVALTNVYLGVGFTVGTGSDSVWTGMSGGFRFGQRTGMASLTVALGNEGVQGQFVGRFHDRFGVSDVTAFFADLLDIDAIAMPSGGPLDLGIQDVGLTFNFGATNSFSLGGEAVFLQKTATVLFSIAEQDGSPELVAGIIVEDLGFGDLVPAMENPVTDALRLQAAGLIITTADGRVGSGELSPEVRKFYRAVQRSDEFTLDLTPGLSLVGILPLDEGPIGDIVGLLSPEESSALVIEGRLPLFGGNLSDLLLRVELPPMAPPDSPEWFVAGQLSLEITGQPRVSVIGALTLDMMGDTLTFDVTSSISIIPAGGIELSIAGGMKAASPWVGPFGISWLTLNEIRLAMGISPVAVRLGFLGDAAFGPKDIRVQAGIKINPLPPPPKPVGIILAGSTEEGFAISDLTEFQKMVSGGQVAIPTDAIPDMGLEDVDLKVATYDDPDIDVEMGIRMAGTFMMAPFPGEDKDEFGRLDISIDKSGITGYGRLNAFEIGPVAFDTALIDLALTLEEQHLILSGGVEIANLIETHLDLALSRDSLFFATDLTLFERFRAELEAYAAFDLTNPQFRVHGAMYNDFGDSLAFAVINGLIPPGEVALAIVERVLTDATNALNAADRALEGTIVALTEATRVAMVGTYNSYKSAVSRRNTARYWYNYHRSRCSWRRLYHCGRQAAYGVSLAYWQVHVGIRWGLYKAALFVYENRAFLENNLVVRGLRGARDLARAGLNAAWTDFNNVKTAFDGLKDYVETALSCVGCPLPPAPFNIESVVFDAELAGLMGNASVDLDVNYAIMGNRRRFSIGWSGSIVENVVGLLTQVTSALFPQR